MWHEALICRLLCWFASTKGCLFDWVCKRKWQQLWNCWLFTQMKEEVDNGTWQSCSYTLMNGCIDADFDMPMNFVNCVKMVRLSVCVFCFVFCIRLAWVWNLDLFGPHNNALNVLLLCLNSHLKFQMIIQSLRCAGIWNVPWIQSETNNTMPKDSKTCVVMWAYFVDGE